MSHVWDMTHWLLTICDLQPHIDMPRIPKCIRNQAKGPLSAHAGIKAAADAVLKV